MHLTNAVRWLHLRTNLTAKIVRIMKLLSFFLFAACFTATANGYSQQITITAKNTPLEKVFTEIEKQSGYQFFYKAALAADFKNISIELKNASLQQTLDRVLQGQPFAYSIVGKTIAITRKDNAIAVEQTGDIPAPVRDIKGKILNEKSEPVIATVTVKGTTLATSTDANGYFELKGIDENATLIITGVNIETYEINSSSFKAGELKSITVKNKTTEGEEIVIEANTGYQRVKPNEVTGSLTVVDNKLFNRAVTPNVLERLDGLVPGLIFNRRIGTANATDISIRGISTLESDKRPLIVVDNFPYEGAISNINPNDVESITVLKDAAATSIWGTRAGNGVIVITTKRARYNQQVRVTANNNVTITGKPDLFYLPQYSSAEYIGIEQFLFDKGFYTAELTNNTTFPLVSPVVEILNRRKLNLITASDSAAQIGALLRNDVRNDYSKYFYRPAVNLQHSVSFSGGSEKMSYLFSAGYDKGIANLVGNSNDRFTLRNQTSIKATKRLELQVNTQIMQGRSEQNSPFPILPGNGKTLYPYAKLAGANGEHLAVEREYRGGYRDTAGNGKLLNWNYKPLDELSLADNTGKSTDILINTAIKYEFTSWLTAEASYQFEKTISATRNYQSAGTFVTRNLINSFTPPGGSYTASAIPYGGILTSTGGELQSNAARGQLNFNKAFGKDHRVTALAGSEIREARTLLSGTVFYGYDDATATYKNADFVNFYPLYFGGGSGTIPNNLFASDRLNRFISFFGNASYTYKSRYSISGSARRDASNLFGTSTNNKWKPLWSAGLGWEISKEKFYHFAAIPYLKFRGTYGYSGNVNNNNPALLTLTALSVVNQFTNLQQYNINNPPNPTLRWEKNRMINFSLEFASKKDLVSGRIEYYTKKSTDLISAVAADPTTGFASLVVNSAALDGKGVDLSLQGKLINHRTIKLTSNFIFSYNTNRVAKYLLAKTAKDYVAAQVTPITGERAYSVLSRRWGGLDPTNGNPRGYVNGQLSSDYVAIAASANPADYVVAGSSRPEFFGAWRNALTIGNFSLSANISYRLKYYFRRNNLISYSSLFSNWDQTGYSDYVQRWQKPGDEAVTNVPSLSYPANGNRDLFYAQSEITVEKGDHIRLQDIQAGYSLDKTIWKKNPFSNLSVYLYVSNLGIIWKATDSKLDPDYAVPPPKSFAFGLKLDL